MSPAVETKDLSISFGGLKVVQGLNLLIPEGCIFGLIGPNGAGKTTVFNMLTGVYQPTSGSIRLWGREEVVGLRAFAVTELGLARTFQNIRLFKELTVEDNLIVASDVNPRFTRHGFWSSLVRSAGFEKVEVERRKAAHEILKYFGLESRAEELARNLPYGDQRRLEIARALATGARLLLLDEPAAGLNPQETKALMNTIRQLRDQFKVTMLLIEHDMKLVMGICEQIAVLDHGIKIAEGTAQEIQRHPRVIEAYLGRSHA